MEMALISIFLASISDKSVWEFGNSLGAKEGFQSSVLWPTGQLLSRSNNGPADNQK